MSLNYEIHHDDHNITRIVIHEPHTLGNIIKIVSDVAENHPYKLRIYDLREFTLNLSHEEIQQIAEFGKSRFKDSSRIALVVGNSLSFGVMRMFEAYRSQDDFAVVRVFWEYEDAVQWLLTEDKKTSN